ncbi:MAG: hypothetical protein ABJC12_01345 [Saprospiraceae bacterium]
MRRSITSIFLLSCFVLSLVTSQIIYIAQRTNAYSSFLEKSELLNNLNVIMVSLPVNDIRWEKTNKEFYHEGKLYDVVGIERNRSVLIISCIADHDEDSIVSNYIKSSEAKTKENVNPPSKKDLQLPSTYEIPLVFKTNFNDFIAYVQSEFLTPGLEIFAPPPEQIISPPVDRIC